MDSLNACAVKNLLTAGRTGSHHKGWDGIIHFRFSILRDTVIFPTDLFGRKE